MAVVINSDGELEVSINIEKEVKEVAKQGYYLEALARLDAFIDRQLSSLLRQRYPEPNCEELVVAMEKSMKTNYLLLSGLVKLDVLKHSVNGKKVNLPDTELRGKIRTFKEERNKILHSNLGHYALINYQGKTDEQFQKEAKITVENAIDLGIDCFKNLESLLFSNLRNTAPQPPTHASHESKQ
ncbi:MAG TPA: hypothetical protein VFF13_03240 [archaeon]|nr:hypothetical protein [archaeon]